MDNKANEDCKTVFGKRANSSFSSRQSPVPCPQTGSELLLHSVGWVSLDKCFVVSAHFRATELQLATDLWL